MTAYAELDLEQPPDTGPLIHNPNKFTPRSVVIGGGGSNVVNYDSK